jgi:hypothetical protein
MSGRTLTSLLTAAVLVAAAAPATGATGLTTATLVPGTGGASSGPPVAPTAPLRPSPVPTPRALRVQGQYYSANWAGFIDGAKPDASSPSGLAGIGATFSGVSATWPVPHIQPPSAPNSYDASWVGLGGVAGTESLLQAGTIEYLAGPRPEYTAFVEGYPNPPLFVNAPMHPGDVIAAAVTAPSTVEVTDYSAGWTTGPVDLASEYAAYGYTYDVPDQQTAEWIVEDPTCGNTLCAFAYFSPETFQSVQDNTSAAFARTPLEAIIVNAQGQQQVDVSPPGIGTATSAVGSFRDFTVARPAPGPAGAGPRPGGPGPQPGGPAPKPGGPGNHGGPGQNPGPGPQH